MNYSYTTLNTFTVLKTKLRLLEEDKQAAEEGYERIVDMHLRNNHTQLDSSEYEGLSYANKLSLSLNEDARQLKHSIPTKYLDYFKFTDWTYEKDDSGTLRVKYKLGIETNPIFWKYLEEPVAEELMNYIRKTFAKDADVKIIIAQVQQALKDFNSNSVKLDPMTNELNLMSLLQLNMDELNSQIQNAVKDHGYKIHGWGREMRGLMSNSANNSDEAIFGSLENVKHKHYDYKYLRGINLDNKTQIKKRFHLTTSSNIALPYLYQNSLHADYRRINPTRQPLTDVMAATLNKLYVRALGFAIAAYKFQQSQYATIVSNSGGGNYSMSWDAISLLDTDTIIPGGNYITPGMTYDDFVAAVKAHRSDVAIYAEPHNII